ncbi:MAG: LamG domain-containing protein, partial [Planctomycetota bacterium]
MYRRLVYLTILVLVGALVGNASAELVGWWKFDEGSGPTAYDSAGDNDGTLMNGAQWTAGLIDGALSFDGAGDYVAIQNLHYDSTGEIDEITVCGWCKSSSSTRQFIASFDRSEYWRLSLKDDMGTGNVGWDTTDSSRVQSDLGTSTDYADGNWHHICGWFKKGASPNKKIFVDGNIVASTTAHGERSLGSGTTRYGFIGVGSEASSFNGNTGPNYYFVGDIDDVRIYDRALSAEEILGLCQEGFGGRAFNPNPVDGATSVGPDVVLSW